MTNSTTLGLVTSLKMMKMVVGVLIFAAPQSSPTSENLTIVRIFGLQDPVCPVDESLISVEYSKGLLVLKYIEDSQKHLVASLYPGRLHSGPACL